MAVSDPGSFCWFELGTNDQPGANAFYRSLFGWDVDESPMGENEVYSMYKLHGRDVGAAYTLRREQQSQGVPPHWMIYVSVESADQTASRAQELGATIIAPPFDVFDFGRMGVIQDPTGAMCSVWEPRSHKGAGVFGEVGSACWGDLNTPDQGRAAAFYRALFGWRTVAGSDQREATPGDYFHIMNGNEMIGGIMPAEQRDPGAPPHWLVYFEAASCSEATDRAKFLGATPYVENMAAGENGHISVIADPQGAVFGIHSRHR